MRNNTSSESCRLNHPGSNLAFGVEETSVVDDAHDEQDRHLLAHFLVFRFV